MSDPYFPVSPPCQRAVQEAAEALRAAGHEVLPVALPPLRDAVTTYCRIMGSDGGLRSFREVGFDDPAPPRPTTQLPLTPGATAVANPCRAWVERRCTPSTTPSTASPPSLALSGPSSLPCLALPGRCDALAPGRPSRRWAGLASCVDPTHSITTLLPAPAPPRRADAAGPRPLGLPVLELRGRSHQVRLRGEALPAQADVSPPTSRPPGFRESSSKCGGTLAWTRSSCREEVCLRFAMATRPSSRSRLGTPCSVTCSTFRRERCQ